MSIPLGVFLSAVVVPKLDFLVKYFFCESRCVVMSVMKPVCVSGEPGGLGREFEMKVWRCAMKLAG
ncbi:hypothetical protein QS306_08420 [Paraburkholderia bonniea]|uniref:hypothetical protein n=1 Tax=Paraburkholderia bonniea TaxID=2152891 RepID=UPI002573AD7B|nr:hypothetical protein [Paraburkholderia bonniea]WJF89165.1 hypothetical protein QS306_08420 [Paraburkholderia bonniea]WJF92481.1 hypothetical protein QS308_08430 [Paraburkholderia bonniea]